MSKARPASSGESQFEYDSQWDAEDSAYSSDEDGSLDPTPSAGRRSSVYSAPGTDDFDSHVAAADRAMSTLQTLHTTQASSWKRALKHKSGVVVYVSKTKSSTGSGKKGDHNAPVFKGEHEIKGFGPAAVFGVVGTRKLWDEWYKEGNLVENLSDTSSLTYMCMKGIAGTSTRDLSLVEKVAGNATGTILFVSTSVVTPKVPRVAGRVRASIALNGWVLEPIDGGTRVTYYLHVNVKTFVPAFAAVKYLARRPTCISKIDAYLQAHGSPPMAGIDATPETVGGATPRRRRNSTSSKQSGRSARSGRSEASGASAVGGLPQHVQTNEDAQSFAELQKAQKLFKAILAVDESQWTVAHDHKQSKIWMKKREGDLLPVVKGEALIEGVTTEQALGTILSGAARKEWDTRFQGIKNVNLDNAFDQGIFVESHKAVFPTLGPRHYIIARGVDRDDTTTDNGKILLVSRSIKADVAAPRDSTKGQMDISGWLIEGHNDNSVKITHVSQLDVNEELKPFVFKILASEMARAPREVAEFVDDWGYAPFFVRWGDGPAELEGDQEGDLKQGKTVFRIGGGGQGTMANGQQKCWLQWSEKMYERGLNISLAPEGVATISKVEGLARTAEFIWSADVKDGATVTLSRGNGDGAEDLYFDGEFLDRTVGMERAVNGGAGMRKPKVVKKEVQEDTAAAVLAKATKANGVSPEPAVPRSNGINGVVSITVAAAATSRSMSTPAPQAATPSIAGTEQQQAVRTGYPEDACLIISKDLYFTRSQCLFIGGVVGAAYLWGKLA